MRNDKHLHLYYTRIVSYMDAWLLPFKPPPLFQTRQQPYRRETNSSNHIQRNEREVNKMRRIHFIYSHYKFDSFYNKICFYYYIHAIIKMVIIKKREFIN